MFKVLMSAITTFRSYNNNENRNSEGDEVDGRKLDHDVRKVSLMHRNKKHFVFKLINFCVSIWNFILGKSVAAWNVYFE